MRNGSIRKTGAFFMTAAVWFSAIAFYPADAAAQTGSDKNDKKQTAKSNKSKKEDKKEVAAAQTPTANGKASLSPKEDPTQIGKRKINNGSDKFFGWLGGSKEKEVAIGRQIAMEVEQQAKLVEDPVVTEYINRVGQNVVLHSDAKIPYHQSH